MSKKKPIINNDPSINFRLSKELKKVIEDKALENNVTISAYVRDLLEEVHNGNYYYKEEVKTKINSFLFSKDFLQLMVWIYSKKDNNKKTEEASELDQYIQTLKKIDEHIPVNLTKEFDKVLIDILHLRTSNIINTFSFHTYSYEDTKTFKTELVEDFLLNNSKINMFVNNKGIKNIDTPIFKGMKM